MRKDLEETRKYWPILSVYERFEVIVALTLTATISVIIVAALWNLIQTVFHDLIVTTGSKPDHAIFQKSFGMIMTLLIAMEFKHSILPILERKSAIVQVRTVLLIALLAIARKFIVVDFQAISATKIAALSAGVLALGVVYWLVRMEEMKRLSGQKQQKKIRGTLSKSEQS